MDELPWHEKFVEIVIDDWIHVEVDDFLTGIMFLCKFKDVNGNEVK